MPVDSQIRIWATASDHITLDYAQGLVRYAQPGERIQDRLGLIHRIRPTIARYPVGLTISLIPEELARMNSSTGAPRTVLEWLEYYFRAQAELLVFLRGETLAVDGSPLQRNLAYHVRMEELPETAFGTLIVAGEVPDYVNVELLVHRDGTFSDFDEFTSFSEYSPVRP